jgi:hypothetical protein
MVRAVHPEVAAIIRTELSDPEREASTHATIAAFTRKVADLFKGDNPTFSNEWFFGACGLDNWGELLPRPGIDVLEKCRQYGGWGLADTKME